MACVRQVRDPLLLAQATEAWENAFGCIRAENRRIEAFCVSHGGRGCSLDQCLVTAFVVAEISARF